MIRFQIFFILCLLLSVVHVRAQGVGSFEVLQKELKEAETYQEVLKAAKKQINYYTDTNLDTAKLILDAIDERNLVLKNDTIEGYYLMRMVRYQQLLGEHELAFDFTKKAKQKLAEVGDSASYARVLGIEGEMFRLDGDFDQAIKYTYEAVKIADRNHFTSLLPAILNDLANIHSKLGQREEAKKYFLQALDNIDRDSFPSTTAGITLNYINHLDPAKDSEEIEKQLRNCLAIGQKFQDKRLLIHAYSQMAEFMNGTIGKRDSGMYYYQLCADVSREISDGYMEGYCSLIRSDLQKNSDPKSAIFNLENTLASPAIQSDYGLMGYGYAQLLEAHIRNGSSSEHLELVDSIINKYRDYQKQISESKLEEVNAKYDVEKKDAELARQALEIARKDTIRNRFIFGALALFAVGLALFFMFNERNKRKKKEAELKLVAKQEEAKKLKELDELKTQFFTNISHELRTPLTLILGPLADAKEKISNSEVKKSIGLAHRNAQKIHNMVNEILDLSKIESGQLHVQKSVVNASEFLRRTFFAFESLAEIGEIELEWLDETDKKVIEIDTEKAEKIINNLVSNAIKYTPPGGKIEGIAKINNHLLSLQIIDSGKGIDPREIDKIFERFYQSHIVTAEEGGGTGVGLALSKELAHLLDGELTVESTLGEGSRFHLMLPITIVESVDIYEESQVVEKEVISYQPFLINGEKPHILVVEDNLEMRSYLGDILQDNYRCTFAKDGFEALNLFTLHKYDLISCDIMMPKMDGIRFKQKINQMEGYNKTPFVFLTAKSLEEHKIEGLQLGIDDYITKPFHQKEYISRIHNLLQNKRDREQWIAKEGLSIEQNVNVEEELLRQAEASVKKNLSDSSYKVKNMADDLHYSQRQLSRIINQLTGMTPVNFILEIRLQRAYYLLKTKAKQNVSEVMFEVGIESASYFARKFKERFGITPGEV